MTDEIDTERPFHANSTDERAFLPPKFANIADELKVDPSSSFRFLSSTGTFSGCVVGQSSFKYMLSGATKRSSNLTLSKQQTASAYRFFYCH